MRSKTQLFIFIGLLLYISVIAWAILAATDQTATQVFPATINRDCAPWDGAAFTVSIRYDSTTTITISIWKSPEISFPSTFSFPDETGQVGYAYILPELDPLLQLSGDVFFQRVDGESPVEGKFDLHTEAGQQFKGQFKAAWGNEIVYCG